MLRGSRAPAPAATVANCGVRAVTHARVAAGLFSSAARGRPISTHHLYNHQEPPREERRGEEREEEERGERRE